MGALTSLGLSVQESWEGMVAGRSGIAPITQFDASDLPVRIAGEVKGFDVTQYMDAREARRMARCAHLALAAGIQAMADAGIEGESHRVRVYGMAPRPCQTVFLRTVFGVVDEEVRSLGEGDVILVHQASRMPVRKFVVGQKHEGFSLCFKTVSRSPIRMADRNGRDVQPVQIEWIAADFPIADIRLDGFKTHGEMGRGHDARDVTSGLPAKQRQ